MHKLIMLRSTNLSQIKAIIGAEFVDRKSKNSRKTNLANFESDLQVINRKAKHLFFLFFHQKQIERILIAIHENWNKKLLFIKEN